MRQIAFSLFLLLPGSGDAQPYWQQSALQRRGLHHANLTGRLLAPDAKPLGGITVFLNTGNFRDVPARRTVTGSDGQFVFEDVNSQTSPSVSWSSPDWISATVTIAGESGENISLGEFRLQPETMARASFEALGVPLEGRERPTIVLTGGERGPRIVAEKIGDLYILPHIPFSDGDWEISIYSNRRNETFSAKFHTEPGRRDQLFVLRAHRDQVKRVNDYTNRGPLDVTELIQPAPQIEHEFHARGVLKDPKGGAISGAVVGIVDFILHRTGPSVTTSDSQGRFDLSYWGVQCANPSVAFAGQSHPLSWLPSLFGSSQQPCDDLWKSERSLTLASATHLFLTGAPASFPSATRAYWWHAALGWQPFATIDPWISLSLRFEPLVLKIEAPGVLPSVKEIKLPRVDTQKQEAPPERIDERVPFDTTATRELIVTADGKPISGAIVDLEGILDLTANRRLPLASYKTGVEGRLVLLGGSDQLVEAFVYLPEHEPGRAIWDAGTTLRLDLARRSAHITFSGLWRGQLVRIHSTARAEAERTVRAENADEEIAVVPGSYDIVTYGDRGQVLAYARVSVAAGERRAADLSVDQRPKLAVRFPDDGWTARITTSTPSGMATGFAIYSTFGGAQAPIMDVPATMETQTPREAVFRISRAGRVHIEVSRSGLTHSFWREIDIDPGQATTVDAPKLDASLQGSMRTYDGGKGFSEHGWAGPRIQIIADDPGAWSATAFIPQRDGENGFTMRDLPSGRFHIYQHLIGEPKTYKDDKGVEHSYTAPKDAWGGVAVQLTPGATIHLQDFIDFRLRDLPIFVTDSKGQAIENATVRVRDRMSEAWRQVAEGPTTLSNAAHPIPYPPAVRLVGGRATLPSIRAGQIELRIELDDGRVFAMVTTVDADAPLNLKLPISGGLQ